MKPVAFDYAAPSDIKAALALAAGAGGMAKYVAGGQSLGPMLNLRLARPGLLIDLRRIPALTGITERADTIRYGAATPHAVIEDGRVPDATGGFLQRVAQRIAYRAVRNRGTMGGSLAHADPAADWVTALAAADAKIVTSSERALPAAGFVIGAFTTQLDEDEIILAIEVPRASVTTRWGFHKICRKAGEFAQAVAAVRVDGRGLRTVIGATDGAPILIDGDSPRDSLPSALDAAGITDAMKRQLLSTALDRAVAEARG